MLNPQTIIAEVENHFYLKPGCIVARSNRPTVSNARAVAMYLVKEMCAYSYMELGDLFNRDHSTIIHNCKKIEKFAQQDSKKYICDATINLMVKILENHEHE